MKKRKRKISNPNLNLLLYSLLCKPKRRQYLLMKWHSTSPVKGTSISTIFKQFIDLILYYPIRFVIDKNACSFFNGKLSIPYTWLTDLEQEYIIQLFIDRESIFKSIQKYGIDHIQLSQCTLNVHAKNVFGIVHRRQIVRDFISLVLYKQPKSTQQAHFKWLLIHVCQHMMVDRMGDKTDRIIYELHHMLQNNCDLNNLVVVY